MGVGWLIGCEHRRPTPQRCGTSTYQKVKIIPQFFSFLPLNYFRLKLSNPKLLIMQKILCKSVFTLALSLFVTYSQALPATSITISASTSDTICSGTMVTFSATTSYGTPHYQ